MRSLPIIALIAVLAIPAGVLAAYSVAGKQIQIPWPGRSYVERITLPEPGAQVQLPNVFGPADTSRPLVVIDAGHGGKDPGAVGNDVREKDVTLALALALKDELVEAGGIRVAMTRSDDRLLALGERPELARRLNADLFVSIHADSAGETSDAQGASVYTLSDKASSQAAALFAQRENDADRINGLSIAGQDERVSAILVELSQRRSQEESNEFAGLVLREGQGVLTFHPIPKRSASLAVLRAPDIPSVLFESGFVTNPEEAKRLTSPQGRENFARSMARAIRVFFARRSGN